MTNTNMWKLPIFIILITTLFTFTHSWGPETYKKIQLKDLKVLTLHQGQMTKGRRVNSVPQLNCIGGDAKFYNNLKPQLVQCTNKGWDGQDYQWECKAEMSDSVRFGMIHVTCEGYDYPNDDYVLAGSCGLNYNLEFTEAGKNNGFEGSWLSTFLAVIFLLMIVLALISLLQDWYNCPNKIESVFTFLICCFLGSLTSNTRSSHRSSGATSRTTSGFGGTTRR